MVLIVHLSRMGVVNHAFRYFDTALYVPGQTGSTLLAR